MHADLGKYMYLGDEDPSPLTNVSRSILRVPREELPEVGSASATIFFFFRFLLREIFQDRYA